MNKINDKRNNKIKNTLNMIINVEGQTNFYPGYPIVKRGIYYGGRMMKLVQD